MEKIRFKDYLTDYLEFNHITNKEFARRIGISEQHLNGILLKDRDLSAPVILAISLVTDIPADYIYNIESNYRLEKEITSYLKKLELTETEYLKKYDYKYLIKSGYLEFTDTEDKIEIIKDILKFLRVSNPENVGKIDEQIYYKSKNNKPELLLLWLEKCYRKTLSQNVTKYQKENIDIVINYIMKQAKKGIFDEKNLIQKFNENGIFLVIEDDIPGSKIRGAFRVHRGKPAIYLTHKHRRIADIYFSLFHELAHLKSDFNQAMSTSLISYEEKDEKEQKADNKAYHWMVSDEYYHNVCKKADYNIHMEQKYPKSFVVYRLAQDGLLKYESMEYQKYNFLLPKD